MSNMIGRVARALCCKSGCENAGKPYDPIRGKVSICQAHTYRDDARAAIAAMRYEDGTDEALAIAVSYKVRGGDAVLVIEHWDGMIDAALAENGQ